MADLWKSPDDDDASAAAAGSGPRRLEALTAPPTLTDRGLSHNGEAPPLNGSPTATPGLAGHRALAALAAKLAEAAAVDTADVDPERSDNEEVTAPTDRTSDGAGSPPVGGVDPRPVSGPTESFGPVSGPITPGVSAAPIVPAGPVGGPTSAGSPVGSQVTPGGPAGGPAGGPSTGAGSAGDRPPGFPMARPLPRLPLPGGPTGTGLSDTGRSGGPELGVNRLSAPPAAPRLGARRLPADRSTPAGAAAAPPGERFTISLRRRAVADLPGSDAPAPADAAVEATAASTPGSSVRSVGAVEPWSAREDDILPGRQVRRARPVWRRR
jgi:hypothetical protein